MSKLVIFLADGFETCEALIPLDLIRRAGIEVDTVSISDRKEVLSSHDVEVKADKLFKDIVFNEYDAYVLPGGKVGTDNLFACEELKEDLIKEFNNNKLICAICAAPSILGKIGILKNKRYTCYPGFEGEYGGEYTSDKTTVDDNVITGKGMGAAIEFSRDIITYLLDENEANKILMSVQY